MNPKLLRRLAGGLLLSVLGLFAWALATVEVVCSSPECAQPRYRIAVRLDVLQGAEPVPVEVEEGEETFSLAGLFRDGGVDLEVTPGRRMLPYDPSAGPLDESDLASYAQIWSGGGGPTVGRDGHIYALVAPALRSERGVPLFGVLFDHARREGVAVAPAATRRLFSRHDEAQVPLLQMRSFAHELLHALNRYHADAAQSADGRLTVEAPTSCIAEMLADTWRLREQPLWALSPATIRHLQSAPRAQVIPGAGGVPFDAARVSARDCELARRTPMRGTDGRLELAVDRVLGLLGRSARAAEAGTAPTEAQPDAAGPEATEATGTTDAGSASPALRFIVPLAPVSLGFPLMVVLEATNVGDTALPLKGRLMPEYAQILVEYRREGEQAWQPFRPLQLLEPIDDSSVLLEPGQTTAEPIEIYFGDGGWTFPAPGRYELRARHGALPASEALAQEPMATVEFVEPATPADAAVLAPLLDGGELDPRVGRFLAMQGRVRDDDTAQRVRDAVDAAPSTALAAALRLSLAARDLRRPIDPQTGLRAPPAIAQAREKLQYVCRDSGSAALAVELADAAEAAGVGGLAEVLGLAGSEPWEGRRRRGAEAMLRYGDPQLELRGVIADFLFGVDGLPEVAAVEVARIAAQAQEEGTTRLLVAGHADGNGTCRGNNAAGLRRAEAVAAELAQQGFPAAQVEVVTLGANRPLDYAAGEQAAARNRRVEVWAAAE